MTATTMTPTTTTTATTMTATTTTPTSLRSRRSSAHECSVSTWLHRLCLSPCCSLCCRRCCRCCRSSAAADLAGQQSTCLFRAKNKQTEPIETKKREREREGGREGSKRKCKRERSKRFTVCVAFPWCRRCALSALLLSIDAFHRTCCASTLCKMRSSSRPAQTFFFGGGRAADRRH